MKVIVAAVLLGCLIQFQCLGQTTGTGPTVLQNGATINPESLDQVRYADHFDGSDIFAKANAAATAIGGPGKVVIAPGTYPGVTSTLNCFSDVEFVLSGVTVTYTGSGTAINCASVSRAKISGPFHLLGTRTSGTIGINLGSSAAGSGLTTENVFSEITIGDTPGIGASNGFGVGIRVDGNINAGTYYNEFNRVAADGNLTEGWLIKPSTAVHANSNRFISCTGVNNGGDNFQVDGAEFNTFIAPDSELGGSYGFNMPGTMQTYAIAVFGGDFEGNTLADFNIGGGSNVSESTFQGMSVGSAVPISGAINNGFWIAFLPATAAGQIGYVNGTTIDIPVGPNTASGIGAMPLNIRDTESANAHLLGVRRTGVGMGTVYLGSSGYPVSIGGNVSVSGNLTVTGAKQFKIDDPIDPANKYLYHNSVESPDMMDIYNGIVVLDSNGKANVKLPRYFESLNRDFRYQLTPVGAYAPLFIESEIKKNVFVIAGGKPGLKVSWQVTGIRHDPSANIYRTPVEEVKPDGQKGHELYRNRPHEKTD